MKDKFRIFRRASGVWYLENCDTGEQRSLRTRDETEANRLLQASNEAHRQSAMAHQIGRIYMRASDPKLVSGGSVFLGSSEIYLLRRAAEVGISPHHRTFL